MKGKLLLAVNLYAGKRLLEQEMFGIVRLLEQAGYQITVVPTCHPEDGRMVNRNFSEYDFVVCCGGDGTLSGIVNDMVHTGQIRPLGYLPCGTTNDFAANLGLPRHDPYAAAQMILSGGWQRHDIGIFQERRSFVYVAAFGALTEASYLTPQPLKNWIGRYAYFLQGIDRLSKVHALSLRAHLPDREITGDFILGMVSNARSIAGLIRLKSKQIRLDDGLFEVMLVRKPKNMSDLASLVQNLLTQNFDDAHVCFAQADRIELEMQRPTAFTLDGEYGGTHQKVKIGNLPGALSFAVEARKTKLPHESAF